MANGDTNPPAGSAGKLIAASLANRYEIEGELGRGGMATVYTAHDIKHRPPP